MRDIVEGTGYYLSCMMLFNGIYSLKILADENVFVKPSCMDEWIKLVTFLLAIILAAIGICFTARILAIDDSEKNGIATGRRFQVMTVKDVTGENYFANFSLIVLTGLSLSTAPNFWDLLIFALIELTLGIIYIKKKMFYMNPLLSLADYGIYECTGGDAVTKKGYEGTFYFLVKGKPIATGDIIKYKNIDCHVIRLNQSKK